MRLFVAVDLDDGARGAAARVARELSRRLALKPGTARITWVALENVHLTIRFLGEVDDDRVPALRQALGEPMRVPAFVASLAGAGAFPPSGPPRVVWLGVVGGAAELGAVHNEVSARLRPFGFEPDDRPYTAHLTIGRVREARGPAGAEVRRALETVDVAARWRVEHVTVYESRLSPQGPVYAALLRAPLAAG